MTISALLITLTICSAVYAVDRMSSSISDTNSDFHMVNDWSLGPPPGKTGAPGENTCTDCHNGNILSAIGVVTFSFSDTNNYYLPGNTYTIVVSVPSSDTTTGFQMTARSSANLTAGSFIPGLNSTTQQQGGLEYINHSASIGINSWSFQWQAPATDIGDVIFHYAANRANGDTQNTGDQIFLGDAFVGSGVSIGIEEDNKEEIKFAYNPSLRLLSISQNQQLSVNTVILIQDMQGELLINQPVKFLSNSQTVHQLQVPSSISGGIYVVSLLVGNKITSKKILF
ncbi:MAG: hypothetical protein ACI9N1_000269 [Flavobacteriales bacterium]|jgi:hypothetical protein